MKVLESQLNKYIKKINQTITNEDNKLLIINKKIALDVAKGYWEKININCR
jgi:hypothetical protein